MVCNTVLVAFTCRPVSTASISAATLHLMHRLSSSRVDLSSYPLQFRFPFCLSALKVVNLPAERSEMAAMRGVSTILCALALCCCAVSVHAQSYAATSWTQAHATFYGGTDASGTMGGACGYGNLYSQGYGTNTAALSNALFNNGLSCGACFELQCITSGTSYCYGGVSFTVTATNNCPEGSYGGWCDTPNLHFDLAYPAFIQLAQAVGGVIPVQFMRVPCSKSGGIRFTIDGNPWYDSILPTNVAGAGDVQALSINGDIMSHNWGQVWTGGYSFVGVSVNIQVTVGLSSFQKTWTFWNACPSNWEFGQTYEMSYNFYW